MGQMQLSKITGASVWKARDFQNTSDWIYHLSERDIEDLEAGLRAQQASTRSFPTFERGDFPLPHLALRLADFAKELEDGRGFVLIRGVPVDRFSDEDLKSIYFGLGLNLGQPVGQNPRGDLIGEVMNVGDPNDKNTRVYQTDRYLPYHTDPSDVVGLLCIRKAKSGGMSSLVSVHAVYNELLSRYPEYLGLFYKQWYYAHLGEDLPSPTSLFAMHEGKLNFRYLRQYIELGHEVRNHPLSDVEIEALDVLDRIIQMPELRLDMMLEPGDIQLANNHLALHSRTSFEDFEDQNKRRRLLRLWLKMPNARKQPAGFPGRNGFALPGSSG